MNCPYCNNIIPDGALACPYCGASFAQPQQQPQPQQPLQPQQLQMQYNPQMEVQQQAAQTELDNMKKKNPGRTYILCGIIAIILSLGCLIAAKSFLGFIFFAGVAVAAFVGSANTKKRMHDLGELSKGKTQYMLCPRCKSTNIQMNLVQTGSVTTHGKTTISDNINPLRPFTHTNIKQGRETETANFGNKCHCLNCGFIFKDPEVVYK